MQLSCNIINNNISSGTNNQETNTSPTYMAEITILHFVSIEHLQCSSCCSTS